MSTPALPIDHPKKPLPERARRLGWGLLLAGILVFAAAYLADPKRAAFDNVILYLFLASLAVGALFLVALEYIAGAVWSVPFRRLNEFFSGILLFLPLAALPLLLQLDQLFHWIHPGEAAHDALLQAKAPYLNAPFFVARFAAIAIVWIFFHWLFTRNSLRQDETRDQKLTGWNVKLAAAFLPVFAITLTVTSIDWGMSLEPHWFSTIYGVYYFSGTVLAALAAVTYAAVRLIESGHLPALKGDHLYSLGALLFAFINFWAYIAFSQFLLIWYANLPEETVWFMHRWEHGWMAVSIVLIVVHFAIPYAVLLPQEAKMDPRRLKFMALWILGAHMLDLYWLVMPTYDASVTMGWQELGIPLVAAGAAIVVLGWKMGRHNLLPVGDPKLERGLRFRL